MLFSSPEFIFLFFPITLVLYRILRYRISLSAAIYWLILASLVYSSWWNPKYLFIIVTSITTNYLLSRSMVQTASPKAKKSLLTVGILFNLGLLACFKYAAFFITTVGISHASVMTTHSSTQ